MHKTGSANGSFLGNFLYDQHLAGREHLLLDLKRLVDFGFVRRACRGFYQDWGRDAWHPMVRFKLVCLQFLYDLSDREVEEQATFNLLYQWFLGLAAEERPPDHATRCRFRARLGAEGFQTLFNHMVAQARERGLVSDGLHILDATHIKAKVDRFRLKREHCRGEDDDTWADRNSPDPDARFGRKSKGKGFYGYKAHIVEDAETELIVAVKTTPGNAADGPQLPELVDGRAGEVTADQAYDREANHAHLAGLGVASGISRRRPRPGRPRLSRRLRPKIEGKFAEGKNRHGLARARYWGLAKVSLKVLMVALVTNLKRLVKLILGGAGPPLRPAWTT
jgi:IS5 family transposase